MKFNTTPHGLLEMAETAELAARTMFAAEGEVPAVYIFQGPDGKVGIVGPPPYRNAREKDISAHTMRLFFAKNRVRRYAHVFEAWMLRAATDKFPADFNPRTDTIRDREDRIEVINVLVEDKEHSIMWAIPIIRAADGTGTLGETEKFSPELTAGRFMGLLNPPPSYDA